MHHLQGDAQLLQVARPVHHPPQTYSQLHHRQPCALSWGPGGGAAGPGPWQLADAPSIHRALTRHLGKWSLQRPRRRSLLRLRMRLRLQLRLQLLKLLKLLRLLPQFSRATALGQVLAAAYACA